MKFAFSQKSRSLYFWNLLLGKQEFINTLNSLISLQQILFVLRKCSHHCLINSEPPCLVIFEKPSTTTVFYLIHPTYLHTVIRTFTIIWFWSFFLPTHNQNFTLIRKFRVSILMCSLNLNCKRFHQNFSNLIWL